MKQLALYISLLFSACCVRGDFLHFTNHQVVGTDVENGSQSVELVSTTEKSCHSGKDAKEAVIISKPKLVVTFMANSKAVDGMDGLNSGLEPPFFMDPFQRLLQFFFSSFARDFTPIAPKDDKVDVKKDTKDVVEKEEKPFEWLTIGNEKDDSKRMSCEHGLNGFCRSCHMKPRNMLEFEPFRTKRDKPENSSTQTSTSTENANNAQKRNTTDKASKTALIETTKDPIKKKDESVRHKRHYFLSISGDTDKRVAAHEHSEMKREKRDSIDSDTNQGNQSFIKILEETIYRTLNKNVDAFRNALDGNTKNETEVELPAENPDEEGGSKDDEESSSEDGLNEDELPNEKDDRDLYGDSISPQATEYSHGWTYFFLVTLPVTCTFAVIILFLCIFLRTRGWCCKLFLKDPAITLQERQMKIDGNRRDSKIIVA